MEGTNAIENIDDADRRFVAMCREMNAYDWTIVRQQLYKFFEDRHIKVSLFIQDKIQGLDGTIYLDFCDVGPQFSVKPGQIKFFNPDGNQRQKQINFLHSAKW